MRSHLKNMRPGDLKIYTGAASWASKVHFVRFSHEQRSRVAHNCRGKTKNLTAKTKYVTVFGFDVRFLVLLWDFRFCCEVFGFAVRSVCFCREVVGFAMTVVGHRKRRQDQTAISPRQTASSSSDKRLGNHKKREDPTFPPLPRCKTKLIDFFSLIRRFGSSRPMVCLPRVILTWLLHLAGIKVSKVYVKSTIRSL